MKIAMQVAAGLVFVVGAWRLYNDIQLAMPTSGAPTPTVDLILDGSLAAAGALFVWKEIL